MNKVLSFVKLDIRLMKPYLSAVLILLGLGITMGIGFKSGETLSSYFMVMLILIMSYPFAVMEKNNLNVLYGTLTLNKKTVVIGRYLFVILIALAGAVLSFLGSLTITLLFKQQFILADNLFVLCLSMILFLLVVSFQYPIYFKLGYTKARMAALIPLFIVFAVVMFIPMLSNLFDWDITLTGMFESLIKYPVFSCLILLFAGISAFCISCYLSCKIYEKKDV